MFRKFLVLAASAVFSVSVCAQSISVNNSYIDVEAVNYDGSIFVPVRGVFEKLGYEVYYDNQAKKAVLEGEHHIVIEYGKDYFLCDGKIINPVSAQKIINSRFYIPLRAVSEAIGADVKWDYYTKTAYINNKEDESNINDNSFEAKSDAEKLDIYESEKRAAELVNLERKKLGLDELILDEELSNVSRQHSEDMAERGYFDHDTPEGVSPFDRLKQNGIIYSAAAENIAAGQSTPEAAVQSWLNSEGHRKNILNPKYKYMGIGLCVDSSSSYVYYWTQNFKN